MNMLPDYRFFRVKDIALGTKGSNGVTFDRSRRECINKYGYVTYVQSDGSIIGSFTDHVDIVYGLDPAWIEPVARTDEKRVVPCDVFKHFGHLDILPIGTIVRIKCVRTPEQARELAFDKGFTWMSSMDNAYAQFGVVRGLPGELSPFAYLVRVVSCKDLLLVATWFDRGWLDVVDDVGACVPPDVAEKLGIERCPTRRDAINAALNAWKRDAEERIEALRAHLLSAEDK
jgi:hypothetical protein